MVPRAGFTARLIRVVPPGTLPVPVPWHQQHDAPSRIPGSDDLGRPAAQDRGVQVRCSAIAIIQTSKSSEHQPARSRSRPSHRRSVHNGRSSHRFLLLKASAASSSGVSATQSVPKAEKQQAEINSHRAHAAIQTDVNARSGIDERIRHDPGNAERRTSNSSAGTLEVLKRRTAGVRGRERRIDSCEPDAVKRQIMHGCEEPEEVPARLWRAGSSAGRRCSTSTSTKAGDGTG